MSIFRTTFDKIQKKILLSNRQSFTFRAMQASNFLQIPKRVKKAVNIKKIIAIRFFTVILFNICTHHFQKTK